MSQSKILLSFGKHDLSGVTDLYNLEPKIRENFSNNSAALNYFFVEGFGHTQDDTNLFYEIRKEGLSFTETHYRVHLTKLLKRIPRDVEIQKFISQKEKKGGDFILEQYKIMDKISQDYKLDVFFESYSDETSQKFAEMLKRFRDLGMKDVNLLLKEPGDIEIISNTKTRMNILKTFVNERNEKFLVTTRDILSNAIKEDKFIRLFARWGEKHIGLIDSLRSSFLNESISFNSVTENFDSFPYDIQEIAMNKNTPDDTTIIKSVIYDAITIMLKGNVHIENKNGEVVLDLLNRDDVFDEVYLCLTDDKFSIEEKQKIVSKVLGIFTSQ